MEAEHYFIDEWTLVEWEKNTNGKLPGDQLLQLFPLDSQITIVEWEDETHRRLSWTRPPTKDTHTLVSALALDGPSELSVTDSPVTIGNEVVSVLVTLRARRVSLPPPGEKAMKVTVKLGTQDPFGDENTGTFIATVNPPWPPTLDAAE